MDWYDESLNKRSQLQDRKKRIESEGEGLYSDLWNEITKQVNELVRSKGLSLYTNGSHFDRVIGLRVTPSSTSKHEIHVKLSDDRTRIDAGSLNFSIDVGRDDVVQMNCNGHKIPLLKNAAILILKTFLFPDIL